MKHSLAATAVAALLVSMASPLRSEPSEYLGSLTRQALAGGFGQISEIAVLTPRRGPGKAPIERRLAGKLDGSMGRYLVGRGLTRVQRGKGESSLVGDNAYLEVSSDGTSFRFHGDIDGARATAANAPEAKLSLAALESIGRQFVLGQLGDLVPVGRNESLTFLGSRYLHVGGGGLREPAQDRVVASIAVFGREVNRIPVIGNGSKVAVWFANDREPVGFDVDWPVYQQTNRRQRLLAVETLRHRVDASTTLPRGSGRATLARFECGYVDLGAAKRGSVVQAGCSTDYRGASGPARQSLTWARVVMVPAAQRPLPDPNWALATFIATRGEPTPKDVRSLFADGASPPPSAKRPDRP